MEKRGVIDKNTPDECCEGEKRATGCCKDHATLRAADAVSERIAKRESENQAE